MDVLEALICFSSEGMYLIFKIISKCLVNILGMRQNGEKYKTFYFGRLCLADQSIWLLK